MVFLDFETTGLNPYKDQIIEVGIIKSITGDPKETIEIMNFFVNLERLTTLPEFIVNLTGITDNDLKSGKPLLDTYKMIEDFIKDQVVVAHNIPFDLGFIHQIPVEEFYCTRTIGTILYPDMSHKLQEMTKVLLQDTPWIDNGTKFNAHRASFDAYSCMMLFDKFTKEIPDISIYKNKVVYWEDRPYTYMPPNAIPYDMGRKK